MLLNVPNFQTKALMVPPVRGNKKLLLFRPIVWLVGQACTDKGKFSFFGYFNREGV